MSAIPLTKTQQAYLEMAEQEGKICPGPGGSSSCTSLRRKGLLRDIGRGMYSITQAGSDAIALVKAGA